MNESVVVVTQTDFRSFFLYIYLFSFYGTQIMEAKPIPKGRKEDSGRKLKLIITQPTNLTHHSWTPPLQLQGGQFFTSFFLFPFFFLLLISLHSIVLLQICCIGGNEEEDHSLYSHRRNTISAFLFTPHVYLINI